MEEVKKHENFDDYWLWLFLFFYSPPTFNQNAPPKDSKKKGKEALRESEEKLTTRQNGCIEIQELQFLIKRWT